MDARTFGVATQPISVACKLPFEPSPDQLNWIQFCYRTEKNSARAAQESTTGEAEERVSALVVQPSALQRRDGEYACIPRHSSLRTWRVWREEEDLDANEIQEVRELRHVVDGRVEQRRVVEDDILDLPLQKLRQQVRKVCRNVRRADGRAVWPEVDTEQAQLGGHA